jgi:hypothetical protein
MYRIEKRVSPCLVLPGGGVFRFESLSVAMASPAFFMREDLRCIGVHHHLGYLVG